MKREPYRFKKSDRFPSFTTKKNGKRLRFWNGTVYANNFITKNGLFIMKVRYAELSKTNRFPSLNGTVNAFLIQNGKRAVLLVRYGSRFKNSDEKRSKPSHGTANRL